MRPFVDALERAEKLINELRTDNAKLRAALQEVLWVTGFEAQSQNKGGLLVAHNIARRALEDGRSNADLVLGPDPLENKMREEPKIEINVEAVLIPKK